MAHRINFPSRAGLGHHRNLGIRILSAPALIVLFSICYSTYVIFRTHFSLIFGFENEKKIYDYHLPSSSLIGAKLPITNLIKHSNYDYEDDEGLEEKKGRPKGKDKENDEKKEFDKGDGDDDQNYEDEDNDENDEDDESDSALCRSLYPSYPSIPPTERLWTDALPAIFEASRNPRDGSYAFGAFTFQLLKILSPSALRRSSVASSAPGDAAGRAVRIIARRARAYRRADNPKDFGDVDKKGVPSPLRILVMGGSVALGVVCNINPLGLPAGAQGRKGCNWAFRLEKFVNALAGFTLVRVYNMAVGGTDTDVGTDILEFGLLPAELVAAGGADVVVNAYGTNDMHISSMQEAVASNATLEDAVFAHAQKFVRKAMGACEGGPPLLVYLDDYLGNEQREIRKTMAARDALDLLWRWYGRSDMLVVSYADAVRHFVYSDKEDIFFSPDWGGGRGTYERQVHPGMGGHISIMWTMAFNLADAAGFYCSQVGAGRIRDEMKGWIFGQKKDEVKEKEATLRREYLDLLEARARRTKQNTAGEIVDGEKEEGWRGRKSDGISWIEDLFYLRSNINSFDDRIVAGPVWKSLPPPLTKDLQVENISSEWEKSSQQLPATCRSEGPKSYGRCPFAWISGSNTGTNKPAELSALLEPITKSSSGWSVQKDYSKLGLVATLPTDGAAPTVPTILLAIRGLVSDVREIRVLVMTSYGERWEGSTARVRVWAGEGGGPVTVAELRGFHRSETSVSRWHRIPLERDGVPVGNDVSVEFALVGGSTFKITGMALCA
eukprot:CAMPEP_0194322112 /NCGR_PEP_ID=MMETSP0171-20130528/18296_1 /TAXON_ID=218684 /ORGANISM="Corethron pennatum, Strain L29A3" /LENGTH=780 /DNA_ID=CAMNT_0039080285 /DNA_START=160 /DNA_END=2502 /DNA_ORIENTATION=-